MGNCQSPWHPSSHRTISSRICSLSPGDNSIKSGHRAVWIMCGNLSFHSHRSSYLYCLQAICSKSCISASWTKQIDSLLLCIFTNWSLPFWGQQKKTKQQLLQSTLSENGFAHRHDVWQFPSVTCSWVPHSDPMCAVVLAMRERWIPTVKGVRWGMAFISTYLIFFFKFVHFVKKPLSADLNHSFFSWRSSFPCFHYLSFICILTLHAFVIQSIQLAFVL